MAERSEITQLLRAWSAGETSAPEKLMPLVYTELRRLAKAHMARERPDHTLQSTALVHEAYLRLVDITRVRWEDRAHFFAMCAQMMRRILVDKARERRSLKRGSDLPPLQLDEALLLSPERAPDLIRLDDALSALEQFDPRKSRVVELRFFSGLSVEETATVLRISPETVMRDWKLARSWLLRELAGKS
jgi:RNA polymerase sigma-70 factor (ECF subfamily)